MLGTTRWVEVVGRDRVGVDRQVRDGLAGRASGRWGQLHNEQVEVGVGFWGKR
jgi:hypothetical protein